MKKSNSAQKNLELREYCISYQLDGSYLAKRYFISPDARDAMKTFFYSLIKSLYRPRLTREQEEALSERLSQCHDAFVENENESIQQTLEVNENNHHSSLTLEEISEEMSSRIKILKCQEFNRWANRWYSLKIPLEELTAED